MSLRTKINGFTAWVNLRLTPYQQLLNNVLMDLLTGTNLKYFVESFTGRELKKLENMDGLSDLQRQTRMDWVVEELKKCNVIPDDVNVDTREFAMRSSDHVFDLLWRLISHDIWFVWERAEYLQVEDLDVLTQVPFKWTPEPPPRRKKSKKKNKQSLLSGFGASATTATEDVKPDDVFEAVTNSTRTKTRKKTRRGHRKISNFLELAFGISPDETEETLESDKKIRTGNETWDSKMGDVSVTMKVRNDKKIQKNDTLVSKRVNDNLTVDIKNDNMNKKKKESNKTKKLPKGDEGRAENCSDVLGTHDDIIRGDFEVIQERSAGNSGNLRETHVVDDDDDIRDDCEAKQERSLRSGDDGRIGSGPCLQEIHDDIRDDYEAVEEMSGDETESSRVHVYLEPLKDTSEDEYETPKTTQLGHLAIESTAVFQQKPLICSLKQAADTRFLLKSDNIESIDNLDLDWRYMSMYNETLDYTACTSTLTGSLSQWSVDTQFSETSLGLSNQIPESRPGSRLSTLSSTSTQHSVKSISRRSFHTEEVNKTSFGESLQPFDMRNQNNNTPMGQSMSGLSRVPSEATWNQYARKRRQSTPFVGAGDHAYTGSGEDQNQSQTFQILDSATLNKTDDDEKWIKFPNAEYVKGFKKKKRDKEDYPSPDECVLELVNYQLKQTRDGKGLYCYSIDDFVDSRVLCALVNSFVPNTFTADLLLNDRWTINLALKTAEKMFYAETPFDAEDLVEADPMAVCAYFAFFLMVAYRYRQTTAVVNRVDFINMLIRECNHDLEKFPPIISNMAELQRRKDIKHQLDQHRQALENLQKKFDVEFSRKWVQHVEHVQNELRRDIREKMRQRFDVVEVPRNITINDFCLAAVINLSLTNGSGFYMSTNKETLSDGRKLVLRNTETGEYIDDFTNRSRLSIKDALGVSDMPGQVIEISPADFPQYEFYFEAQSRNKQLRTGGYFLYQVFPGNTVTWQRLFIKSAREAEYETVEKMIMFFREDKSFINCREPKSGNTALHYACKMGHFDVVRLLLESNASIDIKNHFKCSPINLAAEALQRRVCHYLIEWGCDVTSKNVKGQSVIETIKNDDFKKYCIDLYEHYSEIVPKIMNGDMELLDCVIADHVAGIHEFCCLRSRCINGSTLLHTACYYGYIPAIKELLAQRVDVNVRDYKGATPLHRAKNPDVMEILLEAGAHVNAEDTEGNTPLHVKCYGETNKPSETECIQMLLNKNASLVIRNSRGLLPIHCCAMQGRIDVMQQMMKHDQNNSMASALSKENAKKPPSLLNLSIANDFVDCAEWLLQNHFQFKDKEQDILLRRILTEQIKLHKRVDAVKFLLDNGADPNPRYPGGNSALHYAAALSGTTDLLELLISYRSEIDCLNEDRCTPLFFATQSNNNALHYAAALSGTTDVLELLISYRSEIDCLNEDKCTPLFFATQSNNKFAACILIEHGASVRQKSSQGMTAFDYIVDFEEWIECGYFSEEVKARLKAYNLKHARDLIRAISKKVKPTHFMRQDFGRTGYNMSATPGLSPNYRMFMTMSSLSQHALPPLHTSGQKKYLMY